MLIHQFTSRSTRVIMIAVMTVHMLASPILAQEPVRIGEPLRPGIQVKVTEPTQRLEMIANTSRILTLQHQIPKVSIDDESVVRAIPVSAKQVQIAALRPGFTQLTIWDDKGGVFTVDLVVSGDARELENLLAQEFPDAALRVRPLAASVVISGHVPRPDMVHRVITIAEDYYPKVINNITVSGAQEILLHVRVMEVSRTKMKTLGIDWANFNADDGIIVRPSGLIGNYALGANPAALGSGAETVAVGIINGSNRFFAVIEALRKNNLVKVMADPTLVTVSGRPASFNVGGEFPIPVPQQLGTMSIQYREFGTRVDFVPMVLGNGNIRLEIRPQVSEVDASRGVAIGAVTVPGIRTRWADTGVEMKAGQTLAIAGLVQMQMEAENRGLPWLSDLPWVGGLFRRVHMSQNEIELLILVTPEFVDAMDPHEVPPCGPGQSTTIPCDDDFYCRGFLEVPGCCEEGMLPGGPAMSGGRAIGPMSYGPNMAPAAAPNLQYQNGQPFPPADGTGHRQPPGIPSQGVSSQGVSPTVSRRPPMPGQIAPVNASISDTPSKRYFQQNPTSRGNGNTNSRSENAPAIIGPVGYDVFK